MRVDFHWKLLLSVVCALVFSANCMAEDGLKLSGMFSSNAVLQQEMTVPVWGTAKPGSEVKVEIADQSVSAKADENGKWMVKLAPMKAGGPFTMKITADKEITLDNILVGEVWICSGQSNMEMGVKPSMNGEAEIAAANWPEIRLYTIPKDTSDKPLTEANGSWDVCTPETIVKNGWGGFSAAGYFFGREIYNQLKVPVGLIHTSWGGTPAEAWTELSYMEKDEELKPIVARWQEQLQTMMTDEQKKKLDEEYNKLLKHWEETKNLRTDKTEHADPGDDGLTKGYANLDFDDSAWQVMKVPGVWENQGALNPVLANLDGAVWFRKDVEIPAEAAGKDLKLSLGPIDDFDVTYFNGEKIGSIGMDTPNFWVFPREYTVPGKLVKAGKNIIAVRVFDHKGGGGFGGDNKIVNITLEGDKVIPLAGDWKYFISAEMDPMLLKDAPRPRKGGERPQNYPAYLYNAMLNPVIPYAARGAIWYQGESNSGRAWQYRTLLPAMIKSWRDAWMQDKFAFHIVSLANYQAAPEMPGSGDAWAELREAQYLTAKNDPENGLALAIDIGDAKDIHPTNKQEVGRRLALAALGITYGKPIEYYGPEYKSMKVEGNKIRLNFDHTKGGLVAKDGALKRFAICGADKNFIWADAVIDGDTVVVSSDKVAEPVAVRYAWNINPEGCNLYNGEGLPAIPFRTDDFPAITEKNK